MAGVDSKHEVVLTGAQLAALMGVIGCSPMITQNEKNAKYIQDIDKALSRYYTLVELGVFSSGVTNEVCGEVCTGLFSEFDKLIKRKMEETKAKLCAIK